MEQQDHGHTASSAPKNIPIELLISLAEEGLSIPQIAEEVGCSRHTVYKRFQYIDYSLPTRKAYDSKEIQILSWLKARFINSITPEKLKKMNARDAMVSWGIVFDKQRMLMGQSTENIDLRASFDSLDSIKYMKEQVARILAKKGIQVDPDTGSCDVQEATGAGGGGEPLPSNHPSQPPYEASKPPYTACNEVEIVNAPEAGMLRKTKGDCSERKIRRKKAHSPEVPGGELSGRTR